MHVQDHAWVELSRSHLLSNIRKSKSHAFQKKVFAVVKANAYGHGMPEIIRMSQHEVDGFCVAGSTEALQARVHTKKRILVLSYFTTLKKPHIATLAKQRIEVPLFSHESIQAISRARVPIQAHIKLDTGTSRIGFNSTEIPYLLRQLKKMPHVKIVGIFSHFTEAEKQPISQFTNKQTELFSFLSNKLLQSLPKPEAVDRHIACSAAIATNKRSHFTAVRLGIHLYGLSGLQNKPHGLIPVLSWRTKLIQVKTVKKGISIGYSRTYKTKKECRIGTISIGYADGYSRAYRNSYVLVKGKKAKIRGNICMNMLMIDLSDIPNAHEGDEVTLIGASRAKSITADNIAKVSNTINYEVVTRIATQLTRVVT